MSSSLSLPSGAADSHHHQLLSYSGQAPLSRSEGEGTSEEVLEARTPASSDNEPEGHLLTRSEEVSQGSESQDWDSQALESQDSDFDSSMGSTPLQVRDLLRRKFLFINDEEAEGTGASIITQAKSILDNKRGSDWSSDKCVEVRQGIKDYSEENEATLVVNLMKYLVNDTRKVPKVQNEAELQRERDWIDAAWRKDFLRARWSRDFIPDCVPDIRTGVPVEDKLLAQVPCVMKPKPDIAWGIMGQAFTWDQSETLNNHRNNIAGPTLYDVFFVLEAKSMNEPIEEAENQCMRSGCAMVEARRTLHQAAQAPAAQVAQAPADQAVGPPAIQASPAEGSAPKADKDSFAFTIAVVPMAARMFVNWALVHPKKAVAWHMHRLRDYNFHKLEDLAQLHHDMDNILDWGVTSRKRKVIELCKEIDKQQNVVEKPAKKKAKT